MRFVMPLLVVAAASTASASTLWNQNGSSSNGIVDQTFSDFSAYSSYLVDDFTTSGQTWNLSSMTGLYAFGSGDWTSVTTAQISFFAKTGSLPGAGDTPGTYTANVTITNLGGAFAVTADLSGISAVQGINGNFWIGMTVNTTFGTQGQQFHALLDTAQYGDISALQNPGGGFGFGTGWVSSATAGFAGDMIFSLDGTNAPAPASAGVLGLAALVGKRRRR